MQQCPGVVKRCLPNKLAVCPCFNTSREGPSNGCAILQPSSRQSSRPSSNVLPSKLVCQSMYHVAVMWPCSEVSQRNSAAAAAVQCKHKPSCRQTSSTTLQSYANLQTDQQTDQQQSAGRLAANGTHTSSMPQTDQQHTAALISHITQDPRVRH